MQYETFMSGGFADFCFSHWRIAFVNYGIGGVSGCSVFSVEVYFLNGDF